MATHSPRRAPDPRTVRTRAAILDAAAQLFSSDGIEATSVATVARTAGVGISSIYLHFPSKAALIDELIGAALLRHEAAFASAQAIVAPDARLAAIGAAYLGFASAEPAAARALALCGAEPDTVAGHRARDFLEGLVDDIEQCVRGLVSAGRAPASALHAGVALATASILGVAELVARRDALAIMPEVGEAALQLHALWGGATPGIAVD